MSHEISQTDISGIQLRESKTQPKVSLSREIGEAQIVHTIFGKAKVRIIRKNDNVRRALWLTTVVGAAVIAAFVWQGWYAPQQTELMQNREPEAPVSAVVQENTAAPQTGNFDSPAMPPAAEIEPVKPAPAETSKSLIGEKSAPQPRVAMSAAAKEAVKSPTVKLKPEAVAPKPVANQPKLVPEQATPAITQPKSAPVPVLPVIPQPETAGKPQTPPVVAGNTPKMQTATPPVAKVILPKQPVAATIAPTPAAKAAAPASSPAAIPVLAAPLVKDDVPNPASSTDKQLAVPLNLQSK